MSDQSTDFLLGVRDAAGTAKHPWPEYVACEAALASDYGKRDLAAKAHNLFDLQAPQTVNKNQKTIVVNTPVIDRGRSVDSFKTYLQFESFAECLEYRLKMLHQFNMYGTSLRAKTGEEFVRELCASWQRLPDNADDGRLVYMFGEKKYLFMAGRFYLGADRAKFILDLYESVKDAFVVPEPKAAKKKDQPKDNEPNLEETVEVPAENV